MSFKNKVVLITGGSSGIGAATAVEFTKEGAIVAIVGRNAAKLSDVTALCEKAGAKPLVIQADVSKDEDAKIIINKTISAFKRLDVLVNNAGVLGFGSLLDGKLVEAFDSVININLRAVLYLTTLATPYLVESKGNVVNISSILGTSIRETSNMAYCITKAAVDHFTRGAALELLSSGVRVNTVSPGPVRTDVLSNSGADQTWEEVQELFKLERITEPEECADLIMFLASDKARSITGSNYYIDCGSLLKN